MKDTRYSNSKKVL